MKRHFTKNLLTIFMILLVSTVYGQGLKITEPNAVGGSIVASHADGYGGMSGFGPGFEVFAKYNVSPRLFLTGGLGYLTITDGTMTADLFRTTLFPSVEFKAAYGLVENSKFLPFLYAGVHAFGRKNTYVLTNTDSGLGYDGAIFAGAGFEYPVNEQWSIHLMGDYRYTLTADDDPVTGSKPKYWMAKAGLTYALQPKQAGQREEMEYPTGEGEISLDDIFREDASQDIPDYADTSEEDDALALLFRPENESASMESETTENITPMEFSSADYPDTDIGQLMRNVDGLRNDMKLRSQKLDQLQNQVQANERAIAQVSGTVAGDYARNSQGSFGVPSTQDFKQNYESGLQLFYNKNYQDAIRTFRGLMTSNPDHRLSSNCQYWIGEAYNAMKQYRDAINAFSSVMSYRTSYKFDDALLMSGICYLKLGDRNTARENFTQLVSKYPDSEYAPKAMRYLGSL